MQASNGCVFSIVIVFDGVTWSREIQRGRRGIVRLIKLSRKMELVSADFKISARHMQHHLQIKLISCIS